MGIVIGIIIGISIFYILMTFGIIRPFGFGNFPGSPQSMNVNGINQ